MADEAKAHSVQHQTWILQTLRESPNGAASYETLVQVGEKHHCDTLGAMLKVLKNRKAISYEQQFLMYPMHKDEVITLVNAEYDPAA